MRKIILEYPEPFFKNPKILPIFLPFAGCPRRCIYCDQTLQTGIKTSSLSKHLKDFKKRLLNFFSTKKEPIEIGFFGGTFTGIKEDIALEFLKTAKAYKEKGLILKVRCSTRPDFIKKDLIKKLKEQGLDLIELGVQSFDNRVLEFAKRGYGKEEIFNACKIIKEEGLELGIQLMPGLPLMDSSIWIKDITYTCSLKPDVVRIYPCVVIKGTDLERLYINKTYIPWSLKESIIRVARGVLKLWRKGIKVIRIGLPPQKEILEKILAGPWHPSLGNMVKGHIFKMYILSVLICIKPKKILSIRIPKRFQGDFFGFKGENLRFFNKFGIKKDIIYFHDLGKIELCFEK